MLARQEFTVLDELVKQAEELTFLRKIKLNSGEIIFRILPTGRFKIDADRSYPRRPPYWELELEEGMIYGDSFPVGASTIKQAFICGAFMIKKCRQSNIPEVVSRLDPGFHERLEAAYIRSPALCVPIKISIIE